MRPGNKGQNIRSDSQFTFFTFEINIKRYNKIEGRDAKDVLFSEFLQKNHFVIFCVTKTEACFTLRAGREGKRQHNNL